MQFDIITIFPKIFKSYFSESIIKRAQKKKIINIKIHDLRKYTTNKHKTVDDRPYGGGPGMILKIEPIYKCLKNIKRQKKSKVILLSPRGKTLNQEMLKKLSKLKQLILISGHYEDIDVRIKKVIDKEISIGKYVLTGGEIPAMIIIDGITRLLPKTLGNTQSIKMETHYRKGFIKHPQYTRPRNFKGMKVPKVLLSGNHKDIKKWQEKNVKI